MPDSFNIANSILILGVLVLYLELGLNPYVSIFLVCLGIVSWSYVGFSKERKKKIQAEIDLLNAKTEWYKRRN